MIVSGAPDVQSKEAQDDHRSELERLNNSRRSVQRGCKGLPGQRVDVVDMEYCVVETQPISRCPGVAFSQRRDENEMPKSVMRNR